MYIVGSQNRKHQDSRALEIHKEMGASAPTFCSPIISADAVTPFELDTQCMDRLKRFRTRTIFTLGSPAMVNLYATEILKLAYSVGSCLKHMPLTSPPYTATDIRTTLTKSFPESLPDAHYISYNSHA